MRFLWLLIFLALGCGAAAAQTGVIPNCYNGTNANGAAMWTACPGKLTTTNHSATIATGNTFQTVLTGSKALNSLTIENNNATDSCWLYIGSGSATKAASILLLAGGSYTRYEPFVPSDNIQATCATTADTLYVDTQ